MSCRKSAEEGFSLIEVTFTAFVAFFVLTAIFSVIVASNNLNRVARADTRASALGNLLIEQARAMSYFDVGTPGGDPVGTLPAVETTTYGGVQYKITRQITWVDDSGNGAGGVNGKDYKQLVIRLQWGKTGMRFVTFVRDRDSEAFPPTVAWTQVPAADVTIFTPFGQTYSLIWNPNGGSPDASIGSVDLVASVTATGAAGTITRVELWTETRLLPGGDYTPPQGATAYTITPAYALNSRAVDTSNVAYLPDGLHVIKCEAWTAAGLRDYVSWAFFVDNYPPVWTSPTVTAAAPGPGANLARSEGRLNIGWTPPNDGGDPVSRYTLSLAQNGGSYVTQDITASAGYPHDGEPFTAYKVKLGAKSRRGLSAESSASAWTLTNPALSGTVYNYGTKPSNPDYDVVLNITSPGTGALSAVGATSWTYDVLEAASWSSGADISAISGGLVNVTPSGSPATLRITNPTGRYYQIVAKLWNGTTLKQSIYSNVIGPVGTPPKQSNMPIPVAN